MTKRAWGRRCAACRSSTVGCVVGRGRAAGGVGRFAGQQGRAKTRPVQGRAGAHPPRERGKLRAPRVDHRGPGPGEIGLALGTDSVLGRLDDFVTRSGFVMSPVVIWAGPQAGFTAPPPPGAAMVAAGASDPLRVAAPEPMKPATKRYGPKLLTA